MEFTDALDAQMDEMADACVACGKCFSACPMTAATGIAQADPQTVTSGVVDLLRGKPGTPEADIWTASCSSSGLCGDACEYGVDPRMLVKLANYARIRQLTGTKARAKAVQSFRSMAQSIRVVSRLQMSSSQMSRLRPAKTRSDATPDIALYTGCNIMKTPHILVLCLEVLDRLGVSYQVVGGPSACCGVTQFRAGDGELSGRAALSTLEQIKDIGATQQVSWCPSCQSQFDEVVIPAYSRMSGDPSFALQPFFEFLAERIDRLRPEFRHRVEKVVALNERPRLPGVTQAVKKILSAIPGLTLVELEVPRVGLMSNFLSVTPRFKEHLREKEFQKAADAGITTLATVFHACHRELCHYENDVSFEIVNVMEIIGETMGIYAEDIYKRLKLMPDIEMMLENCADLIAEHGLNPDEVRDILMADHLAAKPLQGPVVNEI